MFSMTSGLMWELIGEESWPSTLMMMKDRRHHQNNPNKKPTTGITTNKMMEAVSGMTGCLIGTKGDDAFVGTGVSVGCGTGVIGTGVTGTGVAGTGVVGTGVVGTGVGGTGVVGTGVGGAAMTQTAHKAMRRQNNALRVIVVKLCCFQ
jgi:hypothetical protein